MLRAFRAFRLLRIFRLLKLFRDTRASERLLSALSECKEEFILFFFMTLILLFISAAGIYYFEHPVQPAAFSSILHSLWWAVVTLTTVGYGDVYPVTLGGRIFTFIILLIGLGAAGLIASALSKVRATEDGAGLSRATLWPLPDGAGRPQQRCGKTGDLRAEAGQARLNRG